MNQSVRHYGHTITCIHLDAMDAFQHLSDTYYTMAMWISSVRKFICYSFLLLCMLCYIISQRITANVQGFGSQHLLLLSVMVLLMLYHFGLQMT